MKAIERHLQDEGDYVYSERVPRSDLPLDNFLFEEKRGYCQQFSGAMALMLRMVGIPTRVVAGFAPGSFNRDTSEYRVRDLDAHSWVEVYFHGIGWVPFDPTPTIAPAESQSSGLLATSAARGRRRRDRRRGTRRARPVRAVRRAERRAREPTTAPTGCCRCCCCCCWWWEAPPPCSWACGCANGAASVPPSWPRPRWPSCAGRSCVSAGMCPCTTTLLGLERRLRRAAGPRAGDYAGALRAHRYERGPSRRRRSATAAACAASSAPRTACGAASAACWRCRPAGRCPSTSAPHSFICF